MWSRMNLASPDLRRTVLSILEMLVKRAPSHAGAWSELVAGSVEQVRDAAEAFLQAVTGPIPEP